MLARYICFMLVLELAAYVAIAHWLHFLFGWIYAALAAGAVATLVLSRLAMVAVSSSIAFVIGAPRAPEHRIDPASAFAMILREWRAMLANNLFCFPWDGYAVRRDPQPAPSRRIPVVLVHGYFCNRGLFRALLRNLEARGVEPVFTPNFCAAFATIEDFVAELHRDIERIAAATGQSQVVLVCHSMGGLAARAYLCEQGSTRVRKLITIASPHHGTLHARLGAGANARQMQRGSRFIGELCRREAVRQPRCGVTSIYSTHDNLVAPQETSRLDWAKNRPLPGHGHIDILGSAQLLEALLEELREAGVESR